MHVPGVERNPQGQRQCVHPWSGWVRVHLSGEYPRNDHEIDAEEKTLEI